MLTQADLFDPPVTTTSNGVEPWRPRPLTHDEWPPDYKGVYAWRLKTIRALRADPKALTAAHAYYSTRPIEFIQDWMDTYNPRKDKNKWMPFVFFERQKHLVQFFEQLRAEQENGLIEKCRDMGATWVACAYSVWCMKYIPNDAIGWGSRKQDLVDKLGDPDSIFEKMRLIINRLPPEFRPRWSTALMKITNNDNGSIIAGESGDNIGRGGRKGFYVKDEAQPLDTLVLTPSGWIRMGDLEIGERVCGPDGSWRTVTHINDCGKHPCYRVGLVDGTSVEASEGHLWQVEQRIGVRKTLILKTADLHDQYLYRAPGGQTTYRYEIPRIEPVQFERGDSVLPLDPYIVGVLIGDGSIKHVPKYRPSFTSNDPEIVDTVRKLLPRDCSLTAAKDGRQFRIGDANGRRGQGKVSRALQRIIAAGIAGCGAETKFIPDAYKFASSDDRLSLLQGLMDTDGSASGGTSTYHTCSYRLAQDVRFLVQSLGGRASLNTKPDHRGFRDIYCLHITFDDRTTNPFRLSRKADTMHNRKGRRWGRSITSITPTGIKPVRCITVDDEDGLYLTEHCIPTHNSAHYVRPELIEAALGDNTNVQIDISSVNGLGNIFHRRRESGVTWEPDKSYPPGMTRVFVMDWRDHPEKTQEWYDQRKAKAEREGMQHVFAQEVDRNYSAAVQNTIISYEWITAAIDAHKHIPEIATCDTQRMAGLDAADEGSDRNAQVIREGLVARYAEEWGERDPGVAVRNMIVGMRSMGYNDIKVQYDSVGLGAAIKSEFNRLVDEGEIDSSKLRMVPWNAGAKVIYPFARLIPNDQQSPINREFFHNFRAQAWWAVRTRFYKTWRMIEHGEEYDPSELISISSEIPNAARHQLMKELAQPTRGTSTQTLRMLVDKKPDGTRSPNLADAFVQCYFPAIESGSEVVVGGFTG